MKRPRSPVNSQQSALRCVFRIIGGTWRSRKFTFPDSPGLRPTPDRIRETLFNWLQNHLQDAKCLDLFCGSGALGLEALSRGARHCTFIDAEALVTESIGKHLHTLQCTQASLITCTLPTGLARLSPAFDVVFLDPPYALDCITACLKELVNEHLLNPQALVYIECSSQHTLPEIPGCFQVLRHKTAGQVQYALLQYQPDASLPLQDPL